MRTALSARLLGSVIETMLCIISGAVTALFAGVRSTLQGFWYMCGALAEALEGGYSVVIVTMLCIISGAATALFAGSKVHSPGLLVHAWGIS